MTDDLRFDALLDEWQASRDPSERARLEEELLDYLPRFEDSGDLRRMARLLALPDSDALVGKLAELGTPAVAPLVEVAADPNNEGHVRAGRAVGEMLSWKATAGLEAVIAETQDEEVRKCASWLLDEERKTQHEMGKPGWLDVLGSGNNCCCVACLVLAALVVVLAPGIL